MSEKGPGLDQFSREFSQDQRDATAAAIKEKRAAYFARQQELDVQIDEGESGRLEKEATIARLQQQIKELDDYLTQATENLFTRITHFVQIAKKRKETEGIRQSLVFAEQEMAEICATLDELNQRRLDRSEMDEAEEVLAGFWQDQSEAWQEFEADRQARDAGNFCRQNNCFLVHAIHPTFIPGNNSLLEQGTSWQEKLQILLALEPTLATSSVHQGDDGDLNLWAKMGVILAGGRIQSAQPRDAATLARGIKDRLDTHGDQDLPIHDQLQRAILEREQTTYNEIVVQNPEVAGFFICLDAGGRQRAPLPDFTEIISFVRKFDFPLFLMQNGHVYKAELGQSGKLSLGEEVSPDIITGSPYDIDGQREVLIEDILEGAPIKKERVALEEAGMIESLRFGRVEYLKLWFRDLMQNGGLDNFETVSYRFETDAQGNSESLQSVVPEGTQVVMMSEISEGKIKTQYFLDVERKSIFYRHWDKEGKISSNILVSFDFDKPDDSIRVGSTPSGTSRILLERPLFGVESYLTQISSKIESETVARDDARREYGDRYDNDFQARIKCLCFHLYGFGEEAATQGNAEIRDRAFSIASQYISYEEYQRILADRLGEQGNFRLKREDLI